jgi:tetratricopeptide (TPR) repeat protein
MLIERNRGLEPAATLAVVGAAHAADSSAPPSAPNVVTDTYHGVQVSDPYRWLENSADPKVHDWNVAEDKRTRQYLDALPQLQHTAETLVVPWSANHDQQWARRRVENPEAHDLYLQARYLWSKRDQASMRRSAALLQQAIAKDPTYARAYAGLADTYAVMAVNGQMALSESVPLARAAAAKLDPTIAEPHAALGLLLFEIDWDFAAAQEEFRRCLALNPGYATGHHWAGINLTAMGQFQEADAELRKAQELDPLSPMISEGLFENFFAWHRFDDAMQTIRALQARNPVEYAPFSFAIGVSYEGKRMYREAEDVYRQAYDGHDDVAALRLAHAQAMNGKQAEARALLEQVEHHPGTNACPTMCAKVHLALGEPEIALAYLKKEVDEHGANATNLRDDPDFAALHADPRYQQLLERILNKSGALEAKR